jgi:hypothetical protein
MNFYSPVVFNSLPLIDLKLFPIILKTELKNNYCNK